MSTTAPKVQPISNYIASKRSEEQAASLKTEQLQLQVKELEDKIGMLETLLDRRSEESEAAIGAAMASGVKQGEENAKSQHEHVLNEIQNKIVNLENASDSVINQASDFAIQLSCIVLETLFASDQHRRAMLEGFLRGKLKTLSLDRKIKIEVSVDDFPSDADLGEISKIISQTEAQLERNPRLHSGQSLISGGTTSWLLDTTEALREVEQALAQLK